MNPELIGQDSIRFANAEPVLAYDDQDVPFLENDEDDSPRMLGSFTFFLEPSNPEDHFEQCEFARTKTHTVRVTPSITYVDGVEYATPEAADTLALLIFEATAE